MFGSFLLFCNFVVWDKNGDDYVDLEEFLFVVYFNVKEGDLVLVFKFIDKDGMFIYGWYNKFFKWRKFFNVCLNWCIYVYKFVEII